MTSNRPPYFAMALIAAAVLVLQITLMRLTSVTLWYHFAFMMISLALLGSVISAAIIYRWREWWKSNTDQLQIVSTALFAISLTVCPIVYLQLPLGVTVSIGGALNLLATATLFLIPFTLGGFVIASLITRHSDMVSRLYFADLGGAAVGALAAVALLKQFSAPSILAGLGLLSLIALFDLGRNSGRQIRDIGNLWVSIGAATLICSAGLALNASGSDLFRVRYTKTKEEVRPLWEKWNPLARITVMPGATLEGPSGYGFGWALSPTWTPRKVDQMWIEQDASAGTPITRFDGSFDGLEHLRLDVTSIGYHVFQPENVCVVGPGGGRDILTALSFDASLVSAIELNPDIVSAVNDIYGDFSGKIYSHPKVRTYVDEARGFLTRDTMKYDFLQISMIDSWAAALSGAFSLAENNLYTVEAFSLFLSRLSDSGALSVSRWYYGATQAETIRLVSLCYAALRSSGAVDPFAHLAVIRLDKVATVIVKKSPLSDVEIDRINHSARALEFKLLWIPGKRNILPSPLLDFIDNAHNEEALHTRFDFDFAAPTDDRPFFFQMRRGLTFSASRAELGDWKASSVGVFTLSVLLAALSVLALVFVAAPLLTRPPAGMSATDFWRSHKRPLMYFIGIGIGFMTLELALIQRFVLYLGHPIYAVTIVIFSLLLGGGLGALVSGRLSEKINPVRTHSRALLFVLVLALAQIFISPALFAATQGWPWLARAITSVLLLVSLGVTLGTAFPLGIKRLRRELGTEGVAWLWGVNTVCSVLASVLTVTIAIHYGYTVTLLIGVAMYALTWAMARLKWSVGA
ncbi:MAG: hypothetical protein ACE5GA_02655 [Candidatus Zixiibacteriota bacterium]